MDLYICIGPCRDSGPSLISLMVSVDVKHHVYLLTYRDSVESQFGLVVIKAVGW